jgi:hypothetical protein
MKVKIECNKCNKVHVVSITTIMEALLRARATDSIYGGFLCPTCSSILHE